jgi:hypothetical protein
MMRSKQLLFVSVIALIGFLIPLLGSAAEFEVFVVSEGEKPIIVIQNNTDFPAYIFDLVRSDGTRIGISTDVIDTATIQINDDIGEVVEVRCLAAQNSFDGWEDYLYNPAETDGFFHYTAVTVE